MGAWELRAAAKDWNSLLPYAAELANEADEHLEDVRRGLAWSAAVQDMSGAGFYARSLDLCRDLKHAPPPDDAVRIARTLWELVCLPNSAITVSQRSKFAMHLNDVLFKKRHLRSASGPPLVLPWRPVLELLRDNNDPSACAPEFVGSRELSIHGRELGMLLRKARAFFPPESVQEIWTEMSSMVAPDDAHRAALALLCAMLPTQYADTHQIWFGEAISLWQSVKGKSDWDSSFLYLFARLAKHQQGLIDFTPLLPFLMDKLLVLLKLPTGGRPGQVSQTSAGKLAGYVRSNKDPFHHVGIILSNCMGPSHPSIMEFIADLMRVCTNFMHPSNVGQHSMTISQLLLSLVGHFGRRIDAERGGRSQAPASTWIRPQDIDQFVCAVTPLTFLGVFSPHPVMGWCARSIMSTLAACDPAVVMMPVLDRMCPLMEDTQTPHPQTLFAALEAVALCMPALLDRERFPKGRTFIPKLLLATVQGLDISEKQRTRATLKVYIALLSVSYLQPLASEQAYVADDVDARISEALSPWAYEAVDRSLMLLDHKSNPDYQNGQDTMLVITTMGMFFAHISDSMYTDALAKVGRFVQTNLFHNALTPVGLFVEQCAAANPEQALGTFVPICAAKLKEGSGASEEEELCMLRVLSKAIKKAGVSIIPHSDFITDVITRYVGNTSHSVTKEAAKVFRCMMHGLTSTYASPGSILPPKEGFSDYSFWGSYTDVTSVSIAWHVPNEEELVLARSTLTAFVGQAITDLNKIVTSPADFDKESRWRVLKQVHNSLRAWSVGWGEANDGGLHWGEGEGTETTVGVGVGVGVASPTGSPGTRSFAVGEEVVHGAGGKNREEQGLPPMMRKPVLVGRTCSALGTIVEELHQSIGTALHAVAMHVTTDTSTRLSSELDTLKVLCKCIGVWLVGSSIKGAELKRHTRRSLDMIKMLSLNPLDRSKRSRTWIIQRVEAQHIFRVHVMCQQPTFVFTPLCDQLINDVVSLVIHPFSSIRKQAQKSLDMAVRRFPYRKVSIIKRMAAILQRGLKLPQEEIKGAIFVLKSQHMMPRACKEFGLLQECVKAVCAQLGHEKTSISTQIDLMFMNMLARVNFSPLTVSALAVTIPAEWRHYIPAEAHAAAEATRSESTKARHAQYNDLCTFLQELGTAGDVHWKQALVVQSCLTFCAHVDGIPPVGAAVELLTTSLYKAEYLGRRLGIISATVVAAMNKQLIGVQVQVQAQSTAVASIDVAVAYGSINVPPSTALAWDSTVFIDSFDCGFNQKQKQKQVQGLIADEPAVVAACTTATEGSGLLLKKTALSGGGLTAEQLADIGLGMLLNDDALQRIVSQLALDHREDEGRGSAGDVAVAAEAFIGALYRKAGAVGHGFTSSHARMWQSFFRLGGIGLFRRLLPLLTPLLVAGDTTMEGSHRGKQAVVAEIVAGVARGSKHWPFADLEELWASHLLPIWKTVVGSAAAETLSDWEAALGFTLRRRDPRRVWWLIKWLDAYDLHADTDTKQCVAVLRLVSCMLRTYGWRLETFAGSQMTKLQSQGMLAHPFKQVRVEVGRLLAVAMSAAPNVPPCVALIAETTRLCTPPPEESSAALAVVEPMAKPVDVARPMTPGEPAELGDGGGTAAVNDAEDEETARERGVTNARDTMLWMASLHVARSSCSPAEEGVVARAGLLPLVLMAHADVDADLRSHAFSCAGIISHLQLSHQQVLALMDELAVMRTKSAWRVRLALLIFVQTVGFLHSMTTTIQRPSSLLTIVEKSLVDKQPENRDRAMVTLSQLSPCMDTETIKALAKKFVKLCNTPLKQKAKRQKGTEGGAVATAAPGEGEGEGASFAEDSSILKRHGGVLGLGGLLCGFPYIVPEWAPAVVAQLAERAFDPNPIDDTAKKILSEFKRTHADMWEEEHKLAFDADQLAALQDALVTPHTMFA